MCVCVCVCVCVRVYVCAIQTIQELTNAEWGESGAKKEHRKYCGAKKKK